MYFGVGVNVEFGTVRRQENGAFSLKIHVIIKDPDRTGLDLILIIIECHCAVGIEQRKGELAFVEISSHSGI